MSFFGLFRSKLEKASCGVVWNKGKAQVLCLAADYSVVSYGESVLEAGTVVNSCIADEQKLAAKIAEAMKNAKPNPIDSKNVRCAACVPDNCTYIVPLAVDLAKPKEEIVSMVTMLATSIIPMSLANLSASYYPLPFKKEKSVLFIGILREELEKIANVFKLVGSDMSKAEPCAFALSRTVSVGETCVIVAAVDSSVSITFRDKNGLILWSFAIPFNGVVDEVFSSFLMKEITDGITYIENNLDDRINSCILSGSELFGTKIIKRIRSENYSRRRIVES